MKSITHAIAGAAVLLVGVLCMPGVHDYLISLAGKNSYAAIIIPALLGLAALYHNPKKAS